MQPDRPVAPDGTAPDGRPLTDRQRQAFTSLGDRLARLPDSHPSALRYDQARTKLLNDSRVADGAPGGGAARVADGGERAGAARVADGAPGGGAARVADGAPGGGAARVADGPETRGERAGDDDGRAAGERQGWAGFRGRALAGLDSDRGLGSDRGLAGGVAGFVPGTAGGRLAGEANGLGGGLARSLARREAAHGGRAAAPGGSAAGRSAGGDVPGRAGADGRGVGDRGEWQVMRGTSVRRDGYRPWFYGSGEPWFSAGWIADGPGWFGATPGRSR